MIGQSVGGPGKGAAQPGGFLQMLTHPRLKLIIQRFMLTFASWNMSLIIAPFYPPARKTWLAKPTRLGSGAPAPPFGNKRVHNLWTGLEVDTVDRFKPQCVQKQSLHEQQAQPLLPNE